MAKMFIVPLVLFLAGCEGVTTVTGQVVDSQGRPVPNLSVNVQTVPDDFPPFRKEIIRTDHEGRFSTMLTHAPSIDTFMITVEDGKGRLTRRRIENVDSKADVHIEMDE